LEDKQVYIFDELAADQDPTFRKYFYEVLLHDLQAQGKTIIAVTHDDKYFNTADRVFKMDYGKLINYKEN
jgi:putative ATP-binding cassette transporter